jgi:hypothetical protein
LGPFSGPVEIDPASGLPWMPAELGWLCGSLRERLEWLCTQTPSSDTQVALEALAQEPMGAAERMLYAAAWERQISSVTARSMAAQLAATRPTVGSPVNDVDILDDELALMLRRSERSMGCQLAFARRLETALPVTFGLLDAGEITVSHARAVHDLTETLSVEQAQTVDASVAPHAVETSVPAFRRLVRQAVKAIEADRRDRHERAKLASGARLYPEPDDMATLAVTMPATDGVAALTALNQRADALKTEGDDRTHGQRQTQALLDALVGTTNTSDSATTVDRTPAGRRARRRTDVRVTIDWASLLGLRDDPAHLDGYGPVAAPLVRAMLDQDGTTLRRIVYNPVTGVLVDHASRGYVPDDKLREFVKARDITCRYPGCQREGTWCDLEHCVPFPDGATCAGNCGLACRKHHNRKTHDGFGYRRVDPATGETVWTTPLGFTYRQKAATYCATGPHTGDTIRELTERPGRTPRRGPPLPDAPPF